MKNFDLDTDEQDLLDVYEAGEIVAVSNPKKECTKAKAGAKATLNKTTNISLRLSQNSF